MSVLKLMQSEVWYRKTNFALTLFALIAAATLFVASPALMQNYGAESVRQLQVMQSETDNELAKMEQKQNDQILEVEKRTKRIMRDLGFNLRIVHKQTDMNKLFANVEAFPMPESNIEILAEAPSITKIVHLVATLKKMSEWEGKPRLFVGFAPEATQSHVGKKPPMGFNIKPGQVYLGHVAGEGHEIGEKVTFPGIDKEFEVVRILPPSGTRDQDILIGMNLKDAQQLFGMENQITEILALGCKCETTERVEEVTAQLELVLPDAKVTELRLQAVAREDQRNLIEKYHQQAMDNYKADRKTIVDGELEHQKQIAGMLSLFTSIVTPLVVLACAIWVGLLMWSNVNDRRTEIGLLRAIGKGSGSIATLFLGKAVLMGLFAGAVGSGLGVLLARGFSVSILEIDAANFATPWALCILAVAGAPLLAAMASYLPTLSAVNQDPAVVLVEQ